MKLLVVSQHYYPEHFQINDICEEFVKEGHQVTVLAGLPNYPTGNIPDEYLHGEKREETINGVHIIRCFEIGRKPGIIGLSRNYLSFMLSSALRAKKLKIDFDLIFVYQLSPILMAYPGKILKKRFGKPLFLYCLDIWPESMKVLVKSEKSLAFQIVKRISTSIYQSCDKIAVQSTAFFDYFTGLHKIPKEKLRYIPQFSDDAYINCDFTPEPSDMVHFAFLGNIGLAQNIQFILEAAEMIKDGPAFRIHFVGDGSYLETAKQLTKEKGLDHIVRFYGRCPVEDMPDFYKIADACLLTLKADNLIGYTIPIKLQGYMAAGKTVIGAISGPAKDIIEESNCGLCVEANDLTGFANILKEFIINKDHYQKYGENGRNYFLQHFTKDKYITALENEFKALLEEN